MSLISNQIAQYELSATSRHLSAVGQIDKDPLPEWFKSFLDRCILPSLVRVGFDRDIAGNIFRISAPAWKSIGPVTHPKLHLHPTLSRDIREVRDNIQAHAEKKMHPKTLSELLEDIPASWVVLPRAHTFLVIKDSRFLLVYLHQLRVDTNLAFEKIMARILIEFIGNYSLKFISRSLQENLMTEAVFYGYAAMFWKNLRQPPQEQENILVFRNYLSWANAFMKRTSCNDREKKKTLAEMKEMEKKILPVRGTRNPANREDLDGSRLHLTIRHGRPGINHAVRYFTLNSSFLSGGSQYEKVYKTLPKQLNALFRELRRDYDNDVPGTRENIHSFINELRAHFRPRTPGRRHRSEVREDLEFTQGRLALLIKDFGQTLH